MKRCNKPGRPAHDGESLSQLFNYIEDNDKCQYTIPELKDIMKTLSEGKESDVSDFVLRKRLKEYLDCRIIMTEAAGRRPTIVSFLETTQKLLLS